MERWPPLTGQQDLTGADGTPLPTQLPRCSQCSVPFPKTRPEAPVTAGPPHEAQGCADVWAEGFSGGLGPSYLPATLEAGEGGAQNHLNEKRSNLLGGGGGYI